MNEIPETLVYPDQIRFQHDDRASRHSSSGSLEQLQFQDGARVSRHRSRRAGHYIPPKTVTVSVRVLVGTVVCIVVVVGIIAGVLGGLIAHALKKEDCDNICVGPDGSAGSQQQVTTTPAPENTRSRHNDATSATSPQHVITTTSTQKSVITPTTNSPGLKQTTTENPTLKYNTTTVPGSQQEVTSNPNSQKNVTMSPRLPSTVYTRWGRTVCPGNTTRIYKGYAAGSHYSHTGGMSTTICLPEIPQWGNWQPGARSSYIYASEYEGADRLTAVFGEDVHQHDVPCSVCEAVGRSVHMIIPARTQCYGDWFLEYTGYLMTSAHTHTKSDAKCVDSDPEVVIGTESSKNGLLFYFVEANGVIPNPPYIRGRELTCSVCSK